MPGTSTISESPRELVGPRRGRERLPMPLLCRTTPERSSAFSFSTTAASLTPGLSQLGNAYQDINKTEKGTFLVKTLDKQTPWFYPFALASLGLLAAGLALRAIPYFMEIS